MIKSVVCPIPPKCSCYRQDLDQDPPRGAREYPCPETATHWLVAPDGALNPGGHVCKGHGLSIIKEFREKIDETWTLIPIVREVVCICGETEAGGTHHATACPARHG